MTREHKETNRIRSLVPAAERVRPQGIFGSIAEIEYREEGRWRRATNPVVREQEM
jgi:hypothetical protein